MKNKYITLWVFSVSKVVNAQILESENFIKIQNILATQYNIHLKITPSIFSDIEGVSPQLRAEKLHSLFLDPDVDMLWAFTGGSASNEILEYLDFELIQKSNKALIGYSDVTILLNALYTKTKKINLLWPNIKTLIKNHPRTLQSIDILSHSIESPIWKMISFPSVYDVSIHSSLENTHMKTLQSWSAQWTGIGWNLSSICLLVNTSFFPSLENKILLIEECHEFSIGIIRRNLFRLREANGFKKLKGIIFWHINKKCYKDYNYTIEGTLKDVFWDLDIPIVIQAWFWHILPMQTLPIGWTYLIEANKNKIPLIQYSWN